MVNRSDNRKMNQMRPVKITTGSQAYAEGSAMIEIGNTRVLCAATVEEKVPPFLRGQGIGWVTAEYGMLPRSTNTRNSRPSQTKISGRSTEIQRLIGRSLRGIIDMNLLGERTIILDCDVLQADGGTRCASITGAFVALHQAVETLVTSNMITKSPLISAVAAVSVGFVDQEALLDLSYEEDSRADVDCNIVMTDKLELMELQGTGEKTPFSRDMLTRLLDLGESGIKQLLAVQKEILF